MKNLDKLLSMLFFFALILLLSGCMNDSASQTLKIDGPGDYEGVLVSEASSLVETSGYEEILVSGKDKANDLIAVLNGKELFEVKEQELQERTNEFVEPGNYRMMLYNKPSVDSSSEDIFLLLFYKDGTIQVNQDGSSYFIVEPPKDLLTQLKEEWNITF